MRCEKIFCGLSQGFLFVFWGLFWFRYGVSGAVCGALVCCLACASMLPSVRIECCWRATVFGLGYALIGAVFCSGVINSPLNT